MSIDFVYKIVFLIVQAVELGLRTVVSLHKEHAKHKNGISKILWQIDNLPHSFGTIYPSQFLAAVNPHYNEKGAFLRERLSRLKICETKLSVIKI